MILNNYLEDRDIEGFRIEAGMIDFDSQVDYFKFCTLFGCRDGVLTHLSIPAEANIVLLIVLMPNDRDTLFEIRSYQFTVLVGDQIKSFQSLTAAQDYLEDAIAKDQLTSI